MQIMILSVKMDISQSVLSTFSNDTYLEFTSLNHINEINVDNFLL